MIKDNIIQNKGHTICEDSIKSDYLKSDSIKIEGLVEIDNDPAQIKAKNKFVQTMLKHIMNILSWGNGAAYTPINMPCNSITMYIGTDLITPTVYNTSVLSSPIGTSPGTSPDTILGSVANPSNGVFRLVITATWLAGRVSGIVGEMGLYLNTYDSVLQGFGWGGGFQPTGNRLVSRLSVADGDFSSFAINTANPLAITWTIQLSFM